MCYRTGGGGSVQHGHVPHLAADVVVALLLLLRPAPAHVGGELAALGRGPAQPAPVAVAGGGGGGGAVAGHVDGLVHRLTTSSSLPQLGWTSATRHTGDNLPRTINYDHWELQTWPNFAHVTRHIKNA